MEGGLKDFHFSAQMQRYLLIYYKISSILTVNKQYIEYYIYEKLNKLILKNKYLSF